MRWSPIVVVALLAGCAHGLSSPQPSSAPPGDLSGCDWRYWDMASRAMQDCTPDVPDRAQVLHVSERGMATCVVRHDTSSWDGPSVAWGLWWRLHPGVDGDAALAYQVGLGYDLREHAGPVLGAFQLEHDGQEAFFTWRADNGTGFLWLPTPIQDLEILWQAMVVDPTPVTHPNNTLAVEPVFHWLEPAVINGGPRWVPALQAFVDGQRIQAQVNTNPTFGFGDPRENAGSAHWGTKFYEWAYADGVHQGQRIDANITILLHMDGHDTNTPQPMQGPSCCPPLLPDAVETLQCQLAPMASSHLRPARAQE